jgi:hypothetical protein
MTDEPSSEHPELPALSDAELRETLDRLGDLSLRVYDQVQEQTNPPRRLPLRRCSQTILICQSLLLMLIRGKVLRWFGLESAKVRAWESHPLK